MSEHTITSLAEVSSLLSSNQFGKLADSLSSLVKSKGSSKKLVKEAVEATVQYIEQEFATESAQEFSRSLVPLLTSLIAACEQKISVEVERSRAKLILGLHNERQGTEDAGKLASYLAEEPVESYSDVSLAFKISYIVTLMRLLASARDSAKLVIASKKISVKLLEPFPLLRAEYYLTLAAGGPAYGGGDDYYANSARNMFEAMVSLCAADKDKSDKSKSSDQSVSGDQKDRSAVIYNGQVTGDSSARKSLVQNCLVAIVHSASALALYSPETCKVLRKVQAEYKRELDELFPSGVAFIEKFLGSGLVVLADYEAAFGSSPISQGVTVSGDEVRAVASRRIRERNLIVVISRMYSRMTLNSLTSLLFEGNVSELTRQVTEDEVVALTVRGVVTAKIDRPNAVITFPKCAEKDEKEAKQQNCDGNSHDHSHGENHESENGQTAKKVLSEEKKFNSFIDLIDSCSNQIALVK